MVRTVPPPPVRGGGGGPPSTRGFYPGNLARVAREGLPTLRIRTFDEDGDVTGEVVLDSNAARLAAANLQVGAENLRTVIDATGGVWHGGAARMGTEDGQIEIAWSPSGKFDDFGLS
jgi:hypothetical protein